MSVNQVQVKYRRKEKLLGQQESELEERLIPIAEAGVPSQGEEAKVRL
jgi:hypothetical protein